MTGVTSGFLDEMQQDPAQGEVPAIATRFHRQLVRSICGGSDLPAAIAGEAVAGSQLLGLHALGSAELPTGVRVPIDTRPWLPLRQATGSHLHPVLLHQRQVIEEAGEGQLRRRMLRDQLRKGEAIGLGQHRLPLVVEIPHQQAELGAIRVWINPHRSILAEAPDRDRCRSCSSLPRVHSHVLYSRLPLTARRGHPKPCVS